MTIANRRRSLLPLVGRNAAASSRRSISVALPICLCFAHLLPGLASAAVEQRQVLPSTVAPTHYDLTITPDAAKLLFKGVVRIDLKGAEPTGSIVLNAKGLMFDHVSLDGAPTESVTLDEKLSRATLHFPKPVSAGTHQLVVEYHGSILKSTFEKLDRHELHTDGSAVFQAAN